MAATEKGTARRGPTQELDSSGKTNWVASITYQVTDAANARDALAQCPFTMGSDHDVYGSELRVNRVDPNRVGANQFYEVEFGFSSRAPGAGGSVNTKARLSWSHDIVVEQVDRDFDGRPITNSVGDNPVTPLTNEFTDVLLSYTRWEPSFNVRKSVQFLDTINDDNVSISFGGGVFNGSGTGFGSGALDLFKGEIKCTAFRPVGEYEEDQSLVQVYYEFRMRQRIKISETDWASGFDWRFLDQGNRGIYLDGSTQRLGAFYLRSTEEATDLVRLDGYGFPIREEIKVTSAMSEPIGSVAPPEGASLDDRYAASDPGAVFLIYKKCKRLTFKGLLPIFK